MRKLTVGLMMVSLLAVAAPAMAQIPVPGVTPGSLDPLGLISSGAVLPFLGQGTAGTGLSFLELYAPVSATTVHMFLFDASCVRGGPSVNVELTTNDVELVRIDAIGSGAPTNGLVTAAFASAQGFTLLPWDNTSGRGPIHARTLWANSNGNFVRVIDPIGLATLDSGFTRTTVTIPGTAILTPTDTGGTWNPLRTAAAFFAPFESADLHTTMYFVCPNTNIQRRTVNAALTALTANSSAFDPSKGFPSIDVNSSPFQVAGGTTPLRVRVYDDEENLLRDVSNVSCNCLTISPVALIDAVYGSAAEAPNGTYTEVEGGTQAAVPAVCSTTVVEALVTPATRNTGNVCPGSPAGCDAVSFGALCTGQFQQTTPGIPGAGPFAFVAYRSITVPGFDVFGRANNGSFCNIQGTPGTCTPSWIQNTSSIPTSGGR